MFLEEIVNIFSMYGFVDQNAWENWGKLQSVYFFKSFLTIIQNQLLVTQKVFVSLLQQVSEKDVVV